MTKNNTLHHELEQIIKFTHAIAVYYGYSPEYADNIANAIELTQRFLSDIRKLKKQLAELTPGKLTYGDT